MTTRSFALALLLLALLPLSLPCLAPRLAAQDAAAPPKPPDTLTLERLFPKKGIFGPTAAGIEFSRDGRYAAWLHHPFEERRHGNDLYLLDVQSGTVRRITDARTMSVFQGKARDVVADREDKAKKRAEKKSTAPKSDADKQAEADAVIEDSQAHRNMATDPLVAADDAEDEKAPRYSGVSAFAWSPKAPSLMFGSESDLYRYDVDDGRITRLTHTRAAEGGAEWLEDGTGFTYLVDGGLFRVRFGSHLIEELTPPLDGDERLQSCEISPDGRYAAFVVRKGKSAMDGERRVKIAKYTGRFVELQEVPRHVSDDPVGKGEVRVYLQELEGAMREDAPLFLVFKQDNSGFRDILSRPEWAPDSSRVVFASFESSNSNVQLHEAQFPVGDAAKPKADEKGAVPGRPPRVLERTAKIVYRYLHDGGPNTPGMTSPRYLADSRHILFLSEQSGFRHLHVLDPIYESQRQLTAGTFEVYPIRTSEDRKSVFVAATKEHPSRLDVYRVDTESGAMTRLTDKVGGYNDAAVSDDGHVLANFSAWGDGPAELVAVAPSGEQTVLTATNPAIGRRAADLRPELFSYQNRNGQTVHGFLFEPVREKGDKRPLLIYVYGGPLGTRKQVVDGNFHGDAYLFARYMTEAHGYVCVTIDPRGMSGYGALFEKANFEQVGRPQVDDLADGVKWLIANHDVDPDKVGIHGWSFGGFQTQMCMYTEPKVFKVGIAGAGPTEWQNYNSWYSTGTIGPSRTGQTDLDKWSLLPLAKNLEGKLLLVHGMEDDNVLYQDTVRVYRELLKAHKETLVELFLDPTGKHGLGGDVERLAKARKYEEFLTRCLGDRAAPKPASAKSDKE
ncbi:MAG: prolyl oligopeptidase family serine peptidase [Planctomycetota bacterium]